MSWHRPHAQARIAGGSVLCTRHQLAFLTGMHVQKVRREFTPVACDVETRTVLIDVTSLIEPGQLLTSC